MVAAAKKFRRHEKDLHLLDKKYDPVRQHTPENIRAGIWFADSIERARSLPDPDVSDKPADLQKILLKSFREIKEGRPLLRDLLNDRKQYRDIVRDSGGVG